MAELFPDYQFTEVNFMDVIKNRIYELKVNNGQLKIGASFPDPQKKERDCKDRVKWFVTVNGEDTHAKQAESLVHESIHIDISEKFMQQPMHTTFTEMRTDEERLVASRTEKFLAENLSLALAGLNFTKMKHGDGLQIPLIPESYYSDTSES